MSFMSLDPAKLTMSFNQYGGLYKADLMSVIILIQMCVHDYNCHIYI